MIWTSLAPRMRASEAIRVARIEGVTTPPVKSIAGLARTHSKGLIVFTRSPPSRQDSDEACTPEAVEDVECTYRNKEFFA